MDRLAKPYVHLTIDAVDAVVFDPEGRLDPERYDHYPTFTEARDAALLLRRADPRRRGTTTATTTARNSAGCSPCWSRPRRSTPSTPSPAITGSSTASTRRGRRRHEGEIGFIRRKRARG